MSFLQSSEWEEFQKTLGRKIRRIAGILAINHVLPGGFNYFYCPRPGFYNQLLIINNFLEEIEKIAREEKSIFLKIDPVDTFPVLDSKFQIRESHSLQPRKTIILDLQKSSEELLTAMNEKTRYNIRLAERRGAEVSTVIHKYLWEDFDIFWKLLKETTRRGTFYSHEKSYYEKLLAARSENFSNELFFARLQDKVLAAALVNFYRPDSIATYLHGASSREHKDVMASYLLHWQVIQEAKARGFKFYDLWGIDEKRWPGVTRFKKGWGGEAVENPPSIDVVFRPAWYWAYSLLRKIF